MNATPESLCIIRPAAPSDLAFLTNHDHHVSPRELDSVIRLGRVLILEEAGVPVGWLRWGMFWDNTPFMNLLYLLEGHRHKGYGRALVRHWEALLKDSGHTRAMTSTQANECAQHFYRHLGYRDIGSFILPGDSSELLLAKPL